MQSGIVALIATGGTIAGTAERSDDHVGYRAAQLGAEALVAAVPPLAGRAIEAETLVQLDSCHMDHATWLRLRECVAAQLARPGVAGVVITHGTDTLEETAYFLHRTLAAPKPVVLTAAMRAATALSADGPQNLLDAVTLAAIDGACGVLVAFGGQVFAGSELRKVHGWRLQAFSAGDAGVLGTLADGTLARWRDWPAQELHPVAAALPAAERWPQVEIVTSHAGASGVVVDALMAAGVRGIVVAGTGNGSVHEAIDQAARRAERAGVVVRRASRCQLGGVVGQRPGALPSAGALTAPQARIELMLDLIAAAAGRD